MLEGVSPSTEAGRRNRGRDWRAGAPGGKAAQRISSFLADYRAVCEQLQRALRPGGTIVMIVGRRSVDGYRLRLDDFTVAVMEELGLRSMDRVRRKLAGKTIRTRIRGSPPRGKRVRQRNRRSLDDPRVEPEDKPCLRQAATASGRGRPSGLGMYGPPARRRPVGSSMERRRASPRGRPRGRPRGSPRTPSRSQPSAPASLVLVAFGEGGGEQVDGEMAEERSERLLLPSPCFLRPAACRTRVERL